MLAIGLVMLTGVSAGTSYALPVLDSTAIYRLFYQDISLNWVEVLPWESPAFGGDTLWKYSYTINNLPSSTAKITWWHVFYDTDLTSSITQTGIPTGWTSDGVGSNDSGTPTGVYSTKVQWGSDDVNTYRLLPGESMSDFEYTFKWAGETIPGVQHYEAGNGSSESGTTTPVPEPSSVLLLSMGILGLFGLRKKA